jgi:hypothetical protein
MGGEDGGTLWLKSSTKEFFTCFVWQINPFQLNIQKSIFLCSKWKVLR